MTDGQNKYNSRAAQLYRDRLLKMAQQACKEYPSTLHINEVHYHHQEPLEKENDFFSSYDEPEIVNNSIDSVKVWKTFFITIYNINEFRFCI